MIQEFKKIRIKCFIILLTKLVSGHALSRHLADNWVLKVTPCSSSWNLIWLLTGYLATPSPSQEGLPVSPPLTGNAPTFPSAPGGTWPPLLQGKNGRAAGKEQLSRRTTMLGSIVEIFWMAFGHNSVPLPCLPPPTPCLFSQNTWRLFFKSDLFYPLRIGLCLGGRREAISLWDLLMIHSVDTPWIPG